MHENVIEKERSYREHSVHLPSSDRSCWAAEMPLNLLVLPEPHDRARDVGRRDRSTRRDSELFGVAPIGLVA